MNARRLLVATFAATACLAFGTEALHWARHGAGDALRESYPLPALDRDLEPVFVRDRSVEDFQGRRVLERTVWASDRTLRSRVRSDEAELGAWDTVWLRPAVFARRAGPDVTWNTPTFLGDPYARPPASEALLRRLREVRPWAWSFEGGAFVGRRRSSAEVVAAIGPTGSYPTLDALGSDRFGDLEYDDQAQGYFLARPWVYELVDATHERLVGIEFLADQDAALPPPLAVTLTPLVADVAGPGTPDAVASDGLRLVASPGRVRWVDPRGRVRADVVLEAGEQLVSAGVMSLPGPAGAPRDRRAAARKPVALWTASSPPSGDVLADVRRFRVLRLGHPEVRHDLVWEPTGAWQRALEGVACVPLALRPLPSAVASFLATAPADAARGVTWWWRDPVVAGGRRPLALVANVLVALACAALARRLGRRHCEASASAAWCVAVGLLAGPLGLLWLRWVVVRAAPDTIGRSKRSLALDTSPSSSEPWPSPAAIGSEILDPVGDPAAP